MKNKLVLLTIVLLPLFGIGQNGNIRNGIEINLGHANYHHNLNGVFLYTGYSRTVYKVFDLIGVISLANGSRNISNSFVNNKFHSTSAQLGVRGNLEFLKNNLFKLSFASGYSFLEITDVVLPVNRAVSMGYIKSCLTFSFQYSFLLNEKLQLGLIHSRTIIYNIGRSNPKLNTSGISLAFRM